jgi:hypothetical protein
MKKESNMIDTKDELIKNFSKEQMEIYNYYKSQFSYSDTELYPVVKKDKEMMFLENGCNILSSILKVEVVLALIVVTFVVIFNGIPNNEKSQVKYKQASIVEEIDNSKI